VKVFEGKGRVSFGGIALFFFFLHLQRFKVYIPNVSCLIV
jgi:hypothetical protein